MRFTLTLLLVITVFITLAQKTVEKKQYYDAANTKLKKVWSETTDGKMTGKCLDYYESGKVAIKSVYYNDDLLKMEEYFETGKLKYVLNKNKAGKFHGKQELYKIVDGKPVLERYALLEDGKILEYYWYNASGTFLIYFKNNVYKKFDSKGNLMIEIINGNINGTMENGVIENSRIVKYKDTRNVLTILPDKKHYEYKFYYYTKTQDTVLVQHGFYVLKSDTSNYLKLQGYSYEAYGKQPILLVKMNYSGIDYFFNKISTFCLQDSVWDTFGADGKMIYYNVFEKGMLLRVKKFFPDGKLESDVIYKDGNLFYFEKYDEKGNLIECSDKEKIKEKEK
jgi:antitoxin component YwqK of YwqJK toxin-antitoxin module